MSYAECCQCDAVVLVGDDGRPPDGHGELVGPAREVWCFACIDNYDGAPEEVDYGAESLNEQCDRAWKEKKG